MYIVIRVTHEPIRVQPRDRLTSAPDVAVAIGEAPDGLPLVLEIWRDRNVRAPILGVLGRDPPQQNPQRQRVDDVGIPLEVSGAIETLQRVVTKQALKDGIGLHEGKKGYTSSKSIGAMLGASLLANALGEAGPFETSMHESGGGGDDRVAMTSAGVVMGRDEIKRMIGTAGSSRRLFVPIPEGRCRVVDTVDDRSFTEENGKRNRSGRSSSDEAPGSRPILFERISTFDGVRFGFCHKDGVWHSVSFDDQSAYRAAIRMAESVAWWIPRHAFATALIGIAENIEDVVHRRGRVHGDIKPANMLVGEAEGPIAIDSLDIEAGRIATVCTPSWAAPEQVTVRAVSPATDVYALGLVLARILGAVVFGEERTFVVPTGGSEKRRMKVLHDPQVFIDPTSGLELAEPAMKAYVSFIARCTSFDPSNRPKSGKPFASELRDLLGRHPLPTDREVGWIRLGWLAGALQRNVDLLGTMQPAWVLSDGRRFG